MVVSARKESERTVGDAARDPRMHRESLQPWFLRSLARFYVLLALCLAVPILLIFIFGVGYLRTRAVETAEFQNRVSSMLIGQALQEVFNGLTKYVESYASRGLLLASLEEGNKLRVTRELQEMIAGNERISRVLIVNPRGRLLHDYPEDLTVAGADYMTMEWFRGASTNTGTYFSPIYQRTSAAGGKVISIASPLVDDNGAVIGYLSAHVTANNLENWLSLVKPSAAAEVILLDQRGYIVQKDNSRPMSDEQLRLTREALEARTGKYSGAHPISGTESLLNWLRLGTPEWTVMVSQPTDAVLQGVNRLTGTLLVYVLISAGLTVVLGYVSYAALQRYESARRADEMELRRGAEELRRSNHELEQFAYVASHDLQEPLRMVSNYCQLLSRRFKGQLGTDGDDFIKFAVDGARRMQLLIEDLLAYSRVGSKPAEFKPTDMNEVFETAVRNLEITIQDAGAEVTKAQLPVVMADFKQMVQVLQNLIVNAIKFRSDRPPAVTLTAFRKEDHWLFAVTDNGIGIDPAYSEKIFVIFQRLHGKGEYPGTGIGLAICKKVVERHGGTIWVESEPGQGATFYFTVPAENERS